MCQKGFIVKNTRFNTHFLLVSLLSVTAYQAYGMDTAATEEVTVTISPESQERILNTVSEWVNKLKNRIIGVEKRQDIIEQKVDGLGTKVETIENRVVTLEQQKTTPITAEQPKVPEQTMVQNVVDGAKKIGTAVTEKAGEVADKTKEIGAAVVTTVTEKGSELKDAAVKTGEKLVDATKQTVNDLTKGAQNLGKEIKKDSKTVVQYFSAKAKAAYNAVTGAPQNAYTWTKENPGKAALIAIAVTATIYLGYQWYQTTKKSAKRRMTRNVHSVTANTITA